MIVGTLSRYSPKLGGQTALKNWLMYYPVEKIMSRYTDTLVTINREDFTFAQSSMRAQRVAFIPGVGLDINRFRRSQETVDVSNKRAEIGVPSERFLGFRHDIPEICASADIYAHPSIREGLPVALMEAMASGLPVIGSDIRGIRDLIQDGCGGFLMKPTDVDGYAKAIRELVSSEETRIQFGSANMENIALYSTKSVLSRLETIYSDIE